MANYTDLSFLCCAPAPRLLNQCKSVFPWNNQQRTTNKKPQALKKWPFYHKMSVAEPYMEAHLIWAFMHGAISLIGVKRIDRRFEQKEIINAAIQRIIEMNLKKK